MAELSSFSDYSMLNVERDELRNRYGSLIAERTKEMDEMEVLILLTSDKCNATRKELTVEKKKLEKNNVKIITVAIGSSPEYKELKSMATTAKDICLLHGSVDLGNANKRIRQRMNKEYLFDKYLQFFTTPYFIFLREILSYLVLLVGYLLVCLQTSTRYFSAAEWLILLLFVGRLMMEIHQVVISCWSAAERTTTTTTKLWKIYEKYLSVPWNVLDVITIVVYIVIFILRMITSLSTAPVSQDRLLVVAGYLYGVNAMLLTFRIFGHIMETKKATGSIQIALIQIIGDVVAMSWQFIVSIIAFSMAVTKIYMVELSYISTPNATSNGTYNRFCNEPGFSCWWDVTEYLVWSLLGLVDLYPLPSSHKEFFVLATILYGLFLIFCVIMLMNMMIALLSNTYKRVEDNAFHEWSYRKAITIKTYCNYHPVPVPFNIISLTFKLMQSVYMSLKRRCTVSPQGEPNSHISNDKTFDDLIESFKAIYLSKYGDSFPLTDEDKMECLMKETDGNREMIGHIAKKVLTDVCADMDQVCPNTAWDSKGIRIEGNQMWYLGPYHCENCLYGTPQKRHGARNTTPISLEFNGFEALILECGARKLIAIGLVPENYDHHLFPGRTFNSVGYHIDTGRIFDMKDTKCGRSGDNAMANRGDLIGCFVQNRDDTSKLVTVSFTRNGREIGKASLKHDAVVYPYIALGAQNCVVLVKIPLATSLSTCDSVSRELKEMSLRLNDLNDNFELFRTSLFSKVLNQGKMLKSIYDKQMAEKTSAEKIASNSSNN